MSIGNQPEDNVYWWVSLDCGWLSRGNGFKITEIMIKN